jgi:hypothetical protein
MDLIITGEQKRRREMNNCRRRNEATNEHLKKSRARQEYNNLPKQQQPYDWVCAMMPFSNIFFKKNIFKRF